MQIARDMLAGLLFAAVLVLNMAVSAAGPADGPERTVIVYYANETTDRAYNSENYQKLFEILRESRNPNAKDIIAALTSEMHEFTTAVERDTEGLMRAAKTHNFDLVIFTNALALDGHYRFYDAGSMREETRRFSVSVGLEDPVLRHTPLSHAGVLRAALEEAASLFAPITPDLVLITNSHGTPDMALMPRVNVNLSMVSREEVLRLFDGGDEFDRPSWARLRGTDKVAYWKTLGGVSTKTGVRFLLVLRLACQSGLASWAEYRAIPESVELIGHTAEYSIAVGAFDASKLFGESTSGDWFAALTGQLESQHVYINSREALSLWLVLVALRWPPAWAYFIPLALWVGWMVNRARRLGPAWKLRFSRRQTRRSS